MSARAWLQVTANGTLLVANASHHADLFWAIRGGGGSAWGVLTRLTHRAHAFPATGSHHNIRIARPAFSC